MESTHCLSSFFPCSTGRSSRVSANTPTKPPTTTKTPSYWSKLTNPFNFRRKRTNTENEEATKRSQNMTDCVQCNKQYGTYNEEGTFDYFAELEANRLTNETLNENAMKSSIRSIIDSLALQAKLSNLDPVEVVQDGLFDLKFERDQENPNSCEFVSGRNWSEKEMKVDPKRSITSRQKRRNLSSCVL